MEAAAIAALRSSPSTTARVLRRRRPSRNPSTRQISAVVRGRESRAKPREVHAVQTIAVDRVGGDDANRDALGAADDRAEELFPVRRRDLFGVVQQPEWPDAVIAEAGVVEQHPGDDQRPGQRAASGLIAPAT